MDDVKPQLPPIIATMVASLIRASLSGAAVWLVNHGLLSEDDTTKFTSMATGVVLGLATIVWIWSKNRSHALKLVAAAATGDPAADPKLFSVQQAMAVAIADPKSPIEAKGATS